jgi:FdhD protein
MAVADSPLVGLGYAQPSLRHPLVRLGDDGSSDASAVVAEEVPIAIVYNERPHVVLMGTPADLDDLAVGFTRTEGIVDAASEIETVNVVRASHGIELQIHIPASNASRLDERARSLVSRTGCGLCGIERIGDAMRVPVRVGHALTVTPDALWRANHELQHAQSLNRETNTVHGAAWATTDGEVRIVREDVGRHNALDKVLGALLRSGAQPLDGFIVVTSRASYEMVQKAAACGVELVAAISRPTGLAIRFADAAGVTLVGLLRGRSANVYTGLARINSAASTSNPPPTTGPTA